MARVRIDAQRGGSTVAAVSISCKGSQHVVFNALALKEYGLAIGDRVHVDCDDEVPFALFIVKAAEGRYKLAKRTGNAAVSHSGSVAAAGIFKGFKLRTDFNDPETSQSSPLIIKETHVAAKVSQATDGEIKISLNPEYAEYAKA